MHVRITGILMWRGRWEDTRWEQIPFFKILVSLTHNCRGPGKEHGRPGDPRELEGGNQGEICSFDWQERKWGLEERRYLKTLELRPALKWGYIWKTGLARLPPAYLDPNTLILWKTDKRGLNCVRSLRQQGFETDLFGVEVILNYPGHILIQRLVWARVCLF